MLYPFINQYPSGDGLLQAYLRECVVRELSWSCLILGAVGTALFALLSRNGLWLEGGICLGLGLLALAAALTVRLLPHLCRRESKVGPEPMGVVEFGPRIRVTEGGETFWADYGQILRVRQLAAFSILQLEGGEVIVVANDGFLRGEAEHFWPFLEEMRTRCGTAPDHNAPKGGGREQV